MLTELQVGDKVSDGETARDYSDSQERVLVCTHLDHGMIIIKMFRLFFLLWGLTRGRLLDLTSMENLVQAIAARMDLKGVRKEHQDDNDQLSECNEQ